VTWLLALVANTVLSLRAVPAQVANVTTVVALLPLSAVSGQVSNASTRVAGLLTASTIVSTMRSGSRSDHLSAVTRNVSDLAALIALLSAGHGVLLTLSSFRERRGSAVGTFSRDMSNFIALIARLLLSGLGALTAQMSLISAVVADGASSLRTVAGL